MEGEDNRTDTQDPLLRQCDGNDKENKRPGVQTHHLPA